MPRISDEELKRLVNLVSDKKASIDGINTYDYPKWVQKRINKISVTMSKFIQDCFNREIYDDWTEKQLSERFLRKSKVDLTDP